MALHSARQAIVAGAGRRDRPEYAPVAVGEAVVNALCYRDVSGAASGTPAQIQPFPDRLTIINPGGL